MKHGTTFELTKSIIEKYKARRSYQEANDICFEAIKNEPEAIQFKKEATGKPAKDGDLTLEATSLSMEA